MARTAYHPQPLRVFYREEAYTHSLFLAVTLTVAFIVMMESVFTLPSLCMSCD